MGEWKEYKLGDVVTLYYGKALKTENRVSGNIPVFSSAGLSGWHNQSLVDGPSIIIGRKGTIGKIYYCDNPFWCIDTAYYILPNEKKYNFRFLYYLLQILGLEELNEDSAVPGLNRDTVYFQEILLPPLPEQKAIASVLSSLDDKIDLLYRQNTTLEKMAETLFRQWFENKDNNDTISQLIYIQNGYAFKSKDFREDGTNGVIKIKNISMGIIDIENTDFVENDVISMIQDRFKINTGDILIAMTGAEIGKLGIIPNTKKNIWLNQRVGLLKEKHKGSKYLAYLQLKSEFGQDFIDNTATGSAQPNISGTGIENCGFPKLSDKIIKEYSLQISELYRKVIFNMGQIHTLTKFRDTLLPKLMSGEIKIIYE
jgi:type I restriction enzyme S subunit